MDEKKVLQPIEELLERLTVAATFGAPIKEDDVTLIPVASVAYGFGYGSGPGQTHEETATDVEAEKPQEGGGGGGGQAKPLGFIRIDAEGVKYEPLFNSQAVSLAGIALVAWSIFWIMKTVRAFVQKPCCDACQ